MKMHHVATSDVVYLPVICLRNDGAKVSDETFSSVFSNCFWVSVASACSQPTISMSPSVIISRLVVLGMQQQVWMSPPLLLHEPVTCIIVKCPVASITWRAVSRGRRVPTHTVMNKCFVCLKKNEIVVQAHRRCTRRRRHGSTPQQPA